MPSSSSDVAGCLLSPLGSDAPLSPDILAAQQSLSFLQGLSDLDSGMLSNGENDENSSRSKSAAKARDSSLPDLLDPFDNLVVGDAPSSLPPILDPTVSCSNPFLNSSNSPKPPGLPGAYSSLQPSSSQHAATSTSSSSTVGDPSLYTGFTVQGGRIPNIPCDTGHFPYSSPCDPLSPGLETPQPSLPPPLIPMASGGDGGSTRTSSGGSTPRSSEKPLKKEDTIDKVYNVLGDIVQTFDNLL